MDTYIGVHRQTNTLIKHNQVNWPNKLSVASWLSLFPGTQDKLMPKMHVGLQLLFLLAQPCSTVPFISAHTYLSDTTFHSCLCLFSWWEKPGNILLLITGFSQQDGNWDLSLYSAINKDDKQIYTSHSGALLSPWVYKCFPFFPHPSQTDFSSQSLSANIYHIMKLFKTKLLLLINNIIHNSGL